MPTLVAALTLAGLLKMTHLGLPAWHLAFWYAAIGLAALFQALPFSQALLNGTGTFLAAWLYFTLLDHTNNITDRIAHYFVLVVGMLALLGARFYIDVKYYQIGL
jgi:hypothetical protein